MPELLHTHKDYRELNEVLGDKKALRLGHNTRLHRLHDSDAIAVEYHETDIVTFYPDGVIILDNGGWRTSTTRYRINQYLPDGYYLVQDKYEWYIGYPLPGVTGRSKNTETVFHNGMRINSVLAYSK